MLKRLVLSAAIILATASAVKKYLISNISASKSAFASGYEIWRTYDNDRISRYKTTNAQGEVV